MHDNPLVQQKMTRNACSMIGQNDCRTLFFCEAYVCHTHALQRYLSMQATSPIIH